MTTKEFPRLFPILLLGGFLRFWRIKEFPLGLYPDEAMNGSNIQEALATGHFKLFYPENNGREGLFINIQALSVRLFGNVPWALRIVSAVFGTLTILGIYLLATELFSPTTAEQKDSQTLGYGEVVALLSAFFLATNFWHLNASRLGLRALTVPFFCVFGFYFLFKGLCQGTGADLVLAGIFTGLGFHTYIAFRLVPVIVAVPLGWYVWRWWKSTPTSTPRGPTLQHCAPCAAALYLFITFLTALPLGIYFLHHPADFVQRINQVSIFASASPLTEFAKSVALTAGMYFVYGDCNWRHNYNCAPELHPVVALAFFAGLVVVFGHVLKALRKSPKQETEAEQLRMVSFFLLFWFLMMTFPATLTTTLTRTPQIPHALRSIGTLPPVMILAGVGTIALYSSCFRWLEGQKKKFRALAAQIARSPQGLRYFFALIFLVIPLQTYAVYFYRWAQDPHTYSAFTTDRAHLGSYLNELPADVKKYVIVNLSGVDVRGVPMPAQTVMFLTDTFRDEGRITHNFIYLTPEKITPDYFAKIPAGERIIIAFLDGSDQQLVDRIKAQNLTLQAWTPQDFVTLKNF